MLALSMVQLLCVRNAYVLAAGHEKGTCGGISATLWLHACRAPMLHDDDLPHPQASSPQQSLSLCNPASGSHSQASPDPMHAAVAEVSDGHMHGMFNGGDDLDINGTPRNVLEDAEATENTANSAERRDGWNVLDSQNVPSPGSQAGGRFGSGVQTYCFTSLPGTTTPPPSSVAPSGDFCLKNLPLAPSSSRF